MPSHREREFAYLHYLRCQERFAEGAAVWFATIPTQFIFCQIHGSLRLTPAMESGGTCHVRSGPFEELMAGNA